ncbi:MAG: ABC transporter permease [Lachnospiraceae bacterium]|nr:ABC transporter permease [Lachnospiraceae bacterium]
MIYYFYRVKRMFRNRILFFWSIIFPMALATLFKMAFSSVTEKDWAFETIPVAVAAEEGTKPDEMLISFLENMKNEGTAFFEITETDRADAEELLRKKSVTAVIITGEEPVVFFRENGLSATIVKTVLDGYLQSREIIMDAAAQGKMAEAALALSKDVQTLSVRTFKGASGDPMIQYFQALLAMASLYGAMYGLLNTRELNPLQSDEAARRVAAPMRKVPTVLADVAAAFTIQYVQFLILIAYYTFILRINFGAVNGWLFLSGAVYSLFGVLIGYFVGSVVRKSDNVQQAVMMSTVMFSCFLAGLMMGNIRIEIELAAPWVNRINPATLIANSLHALCVMGDMKKYAVCMISILVWCAVLVFGSVSALALYQRHDRKGAKNE